MRTNGRCVWLTIEGIVQGVGFRPFLHRLAQQYEVTGWVQNTGEGVSGQIEGDVTEIEAFVAAIRREAPSPAYIESVHIEPIEAGAQSNVSTQSEACAQDEKSASEDVDTRNEASAKSEASVQDGQNASEEVRASNGERVHLRKFEIKESRDCEHTTLIPADRAVCEDCRRELNTKGNRRYHYPFINCTHCGPRYTIINNLPYDRERTSMREFTMCPNCRREYQTIEDRRYHAQPDCCPECGPQVFYCESSIGGDAGLDGDTGWSDGAMRLAADALLHGKIVAIRGIGGIHLACNAANEAAVMRLREKKRRMTKPFALMCGSLEEAAKLCEISEQEAAVLAGDRRPIVMLKPKKEFPYQQAAGVSPRVGVMLPYTPMHEMLFTMMSEISGDGREWLVMTSANMPGCPVFTDNDEALGALGGIADGFLLHNRPIVNRCDDSLLSVFRGKEYFFRKSRGYAPEPLFVGRDVEGIVAFGAEQKASFAMGRGRHVFVSPHIGDLKNAETLVHYRQAGETYRRLFGIKPKLYVCDAHADFLSTREAEAATKADGVPLIRVQHHHAHLASCMADNGRTEKTFGVIWDGTGLAPDGSIWGAEFLEGDLNEYRRLGSIRPIALIGGDKATEEIGRIACALLWDADVSENEVFPMSAEKREPLKRLVTSRYTIKASSMGRLFDGICAMICGKIIVEYEGEGAVLLESMSRVEEPDFSRTELNTYTREYYEENGVCIFDTRPMIREIAQEIYAGKEKCDIARKFMETLCYMALEQIEKLNMEQLPVALSGGVFQNRFLLSGITQLAEQAGYTVLTHSRVAPGDEGICLGQLAIGWAEAEKKHSQKTEFLHDYLCRDVTNKLQWCKRSRMEDYYVSCDSTED